MHRTTNVENNLYPLNLIFELIPIAATAQSTNTKIPPLEKPARFFMETSTPITVPNPMPKGSLFIQIIKAAKITSDMYLYLVGIIFLLCSHKRFSILITNTISTATNNNCVKSNNAIINGYKIKR